MRLRVVGEEMLVFCERKKRDHESWDDMMEVVTNYNVHPDLDHKPVFVDFVERLGHFVAPWSAIILDFFFFFIVEACRDRNSRLSQRKDG